MAQSTRRPGAAAEVRPPGTAASVVGGLLLAAGVALAASRGADPTVVVAAVVLGVAAGAGAILLPGWWGLLAFVAALTAGAGVLARLDRAATPAWFAAVLLGLVVGRRLDARRRRPSTSDPAAGGPSTGTALRLVVDDGTDEVETLEPSEADVHEAFRALDGRTRSGMSLFRGAARLDVGGSAAGPLVVVVCDDVGAKPAVWSLLVGPPQPLAEVEVRVAGLDGHLPAGTTTDPASALVALESFLRTGRRAPSLAWRTDRGVEDLRAPFERWG